MTLERHIDVDHVAGALALATWRPEHSRVSPLIVRVVEVLHRQFVEVERGPIRVGRVAVTITTGSAELAPSVLKVLRKRAARDDVDGQVLVATGGAGVGVPAIVGGKPCVLVYVRAYRPPLTACR